MTIEHYDFGEIIVDGKEFHSDLVVYPSKVDEGWWRKEGHYLQTVDLFRPVASKPEIIVIGTGYNGVMRVAPEVEPFLKERGIECRIARTQEAVRITNELAEAGKRVVACLHLTC